MPNMVIVIFCGTDEYIIRNLRTKNVMLITRVSYDVKRDNHSPIIYN